LLLLVVLTRVLAPPGLCVQWLVSRCQLIALVLAPPAPLLLLLVVLTCVLAPPGLCVQLGAALIKKLAGSKKKAKKVPRVFFQNKCSGTKTKVRSGCRGSPPLPPPRRFCQFPSHRKLTPLASIA
jgi:hypothetical protein